MKDIRDSAIFKQYPGSERAVEKHRFWSRLVSLASLMVLIFGALGVSLAVVAVFLDEADQLLRIAWFIMLFMVFGTILHQVSINKLRNATLLIEGKVKELATAINVPHEKLYSMSSLKVSFEVNQSLRAMNHDLERFMAVDTQKLEESWGQQVGEFMAEGLKKEINLRFSKFGHLQKLLVEFGFINPVSS